MAELPNQIPKDEGFVTKSVDTPILDNATKSQITPGPTIVENSGGFSGFYQANKIYFWAIIVGSIVIGVLAYFAFRKVPVPPVTEANVAINVDIPEKIASGSEAVYRITVQNNDSQKLVGMQLELAYDDGMAYVSSNPKASNLSGSIFDIPDLIPNQNVPVFVKIKVEGNVDEKKTLQVKLHYKYANFNSTFEKQESATVSLLASDVLVELEGPADTNGTQLVVYTLNYQNNSSQDILNARVKLTYPDGFAFASASPVPSLGTDTWNLGTLAKGVNGSIQIQGSFKGVNPGESKTATAEFLILGNDGQYFTQNSSTFTTAISSTPLFVSQEITSYGNSADLIDPGDTVNFNLRYQNNSSVTARGVNIVVTLNSKAVDLSSINAEGAQVNNNTIIWNASSASQLENLAPSESGQLNFSLKIYNPASKDSSKNLTLISEAKIKSNEYDSYFPGNQLTVKISSPSAISRALTFVSGQLPPQVGKSTTYKVRLSLTNSSNDYSNGVLTAFIPVGGFITSSVTAAEAKNVQFDASTGKLTWNFGTLSAYAGRFGPARVLEFQLTFRPSAGQAGQSPVLVKDIAFTAKDSFTLRDINVSAENIATNSISGTDGGYSNGVVGK